MKMTRSWREIMYNTAIGLGMMSMPFLFSFTTEPHAEASMGPSILIAIVIVALFSISVKVINYFLKVRFETEPIKEEVKKKETKVIPIRKN